jgi:uracil-DNA glycosylase
MTSPTPAASLETLREQARDRRDCPLWENATHASEAEHPRTQGVPERELAAIRPELVVALGATAAQSAFGKIIPINKNRGRPIELGQEFKVLVTVHPSYLLRIPDQQDKAREYARFVDDLRVAADLLRKSSRVA